MEINMPKISIIVPIYKAEKYINRCLDSILAQTFTDWELLLVDDGSPDRSGEICDEYAARDKRIRVFHKENGGVSSARNLGIEHALGDWIVFVDADDWCEPNYLSDFFVDNKLSVDDIVLQGRRDEVDGKIVGSIMLKDKFYTNIGEGILENNLLTFGAPYCKLYSRRIIEENRIYFPEAYSYGEDTTFFLKVLSVVKRIITTSKCNYHYVDAIEGSLSKKDHDFKPLSLFLQDSMALVKDIDAKSNANNILVRSYQTSYRNLILRSIVNMYRLGYSYSKKTSCFKDIKQNLLGNMEGEKNLTWCLLRFVPTPMLVFLFYIVVKLRK